MSFIKKEWFDRNDPSFDKNNSPELDATNLNYIEDMLESYDDAFDTLSTIDGKFSLPVSQTITTLPTTLNWSLTRDTNDASIVTFDEDQNTITFLKAGRFLFRTSTEITAGTTNPTMVTTRLVDISDDSTIHEDYEVLTLSILEKQIIVTNKNFIVEAASLPLVIKINILANGSGMSASASNYTLNAFFSGAELVSHSSLVGLTENNCHPISAITNLETTINGNIITGEAI